MIDTRQRQFPSRAPCTLESTGCAFVSYAGRTQRLRRGTRSTLARRKRAQRAGEGRWGATRALPAAGLPRSELLDSAAMRHMITLHLSVIARMSSHAFRGSAMRRSTPRQAHGNGCNRRCSRRTRIDSKLPFITNAVRSATMFGHGRKHLQKDLPCCEIGRGE